jgi:hypothetical protein
MENLVFDKLVAGDYPLVTDNVTILSGQNLVRGTLLGKITATGKYIKCVSTAVDGSQTPQVILSEDCDASAADQSAVVYLSGAFNQAAVTFGGADTAATHRSALRDLNIYLKSGV